MKITQQRLKEIIKEELGGISEASLNPEWDKVSKIKSDLVYLADDLERSGRGAELASTIVQELHGAVRAMEARLSEAFASASYEAPVEEEI